MAEQTTFTDADRDRLLDDIEADLAQAAGAGSDDAGVGQVDASQAHGGAGVLDLGGQGVAVDHGALDPRLGDAALGALAAAMRAGTRGAPAGWCILDNTAGGHAMGDAARLQAMLAAK